MAETTRINLVRGLVLLGVALALVFGLGRLLTSDAGSVVGVDYHAGKIEASNNSSFSHSHSSSSNSIFQARRIAIARVDDHPVLEQVVNQLRFSLLELQFVDEVDVFGPSETHKPGGALYDAYLTLSIEVLRDDKIFVERDFEAAIQVAAGTMPFNSHSTYTDHLSTPGINYSINGEIDHTSKSTQAGTPYKMIADNIGEEIAGKLAEQYTKWHEEFGADVVWPEDLVGAYPADLTIPWPDKVSMDTVVDGYGLMQHRHALWSIETDNPIAIMQAFHLAYTDAGWRIDSDAIIENDEHHSRYHFRAWDGSPHQVEVFEVRDGYGGRKPGETSRVCVRYQHRFDRPETRAVINSLLEKGDDLVVLRHLNRQMGREQKDRYFQILTGSAPSDPRLLLDLAHHHHHKKMPEQARDYLVRAFMQSNRQNRNAGFKDKIQKAAKDMGFERINGPPLTAESLSKYGYQPLENILGERIVLKTNEPLLFYYETVDGLSSVDLWLEPTPGDASRVLLHDYERQAGSWGSTVGGGSYDAGGLYKTHHTYNATLGTVAINIQQRLAIEGVFDVDVVLTESP